MFWPNAPKIKPVGDFVYITPAFDWEGISKQKFIEILKEFSSFLSKN